MVGKNPENREPEPIGNEAAIEGTPESGSVALVEGKGYSWESQAKKTADYIKAETLGTEEALKEIEGGVKENSDLHKQAKELAYLKWKEREKNGQPGDEKSDFLSAVKEIKEAHWLKQAFLAERQKRLEVLSSVELGSKDEELNKLAFEKAEALKKKGEKVDDIKCNDIARQELLEELGKEIDIRELEKQIEEQEGKKEKVEKPAPAPEKDAEVVLKYREELVKSFGSLVESNPLLLDEEDPGHSERETVIKENYSKMQRAAFKLTGESFDARVRTTARAEVDKRNAEIEKENKDRANEPGYRERGKIRIINRTEFFKEENRAKLEKEEQTRKCGQGIRVGWNRLSDKEKRKFLVEKKGGKHTKEELLEGAKKYGRELEAKRIELGKKGINFPLDVYYGLLIEGADPQKTKIKGWFSKKILIPYAPGSFEDQHGKLIDKATYWKIGYPKEFASLMATKEAEYVSKMKNDVGAKMEETYLRGKKAWMSRKLVAMGEVIKKINSDKSVDTGAINRGERNTEAFKEKITKSELDLLSDEQLAAKREELDKTFNERVNKFKEIIDKDCGPICKTLGLSPEETEAFIKAAKNEGSAPNLNKKSKDFLGDILKNLDRIKKEYQSASTPIRAIENQRVEKKIEEGLTGIKDKLAAIGV